MPDCKLCDTFYYTSDNGPTKCPAYAVGDKYHPRFWVSAEWVHQHTHHIHTSRTSLFSHFPIRHRYVTPSTPHCTLSQEIDARTHRCNDVHAAPVFCLWWRSLRFVTTRNFIRTPRLSFLFHTTPFRVMLGCGVCAEPYNATLQPMRLRHVVHLGLPF